MKYKFTISILLFAAGVILFPSCQKELSCEGPACHGIYDDGKAVYSFVQSNGSCTNVVVNGNYSKGVQLNNSNTIAVKMNVTKTGAYTISTDTVNGFYFNGQGAFTDTGFVTLMLKGIGKPLSAGNYNFISSRNSGCGFSVGIDTVAVVENYFFDFMLDGVHYHQTVGDGAQLANIVSAGNAVVLFAGINNGTWYLNTDGTTSAPGLYIGKGFIQRQAVTQSSLAVFFAAGSYPFSDPTSLNDITISWYAKKDESWFSHRSPGIQSGSHFTITSVETYTDAQGRPIAKVKASFNCILYNYAGVYKVLTNGRFYGEFTNFLR